MTLLCFFFFVCMFFFSIVTFPTINRSLSKSSFKSSTRRAKSYNTCFEEKRGKLYEMLKLETGVREKERERIEDNDLRKF